MMVPALDNPLVWSMLAERPTAPAAGWKIADRPLASATIDGGDDGAMTPQRRDPAPIFRAAVGDFRAGRLDRAEAGFRRVLDVAPGHADSLYYLGVIAARIGRHDLAIALIERAAGIRPSVADYQNDLGLSLHAVGRFGEAVETLISAVRLQPNLAEAHNNLGNALKALGRKQDAAESFRRAIALKPGLAAAHNNLGVTLADQDLLPEAERCYRAALASVPSYPEAFNNLANAVRGQGSWQESIDHARRAVALAPDYPEAHYNLAWSLLLTGQYGEGWQEFEWRWRLPGGGRRSFGVPQWRGEDLGDRVLLLHAEQGAGDSFLFCRYAILAAERGRVLLEAPAALLGVLADLPGLAGTIPVGAPLPKIDCHCPLASLPLAFGTALTTIPAATPYLRPSPSRTEAWRERLRPAPGKRIGLVWSGNPAQRDDRRRSIALARLAPFGRVPGCTFVSLQKGRVEAAPSGLDLLDWTTELHDYADTAALIAALDLIIAVDTGVAHLAGALGQPVWLLNRFDPYFIWLTDRPDSPWYPTLRQFRQTVPGGWDGVIGEVCRALAVFAGSAPR
jgi:tetratricopeptide (TPR) repeat protein